MASHVFPISNRRPRASIDRRDAYLRRFQLLRYRDITKLCEVMETVVPIHGSGNFPTLEIRPSELVQMVRDRLEMIGVKVRDIRLNGSAATHVLSDEVIPTYKDLDLIFAVDFPSAICAEYDRKMVTEASPLAPFGMSDVTRRRSLSMAANGVQSDFCEQDECWSVDDSGYTSSGSSVVSDAVATSAAVQLLLLRSKKKMRLRASSEESSFSSSCPSRLPSEDVNFLQQHNLPQHHNWQEIKDAIMDILLDFLPPNVSRSRMNSVVLGSAYVQKMVKVCNDTDRWSLISLNNNSGRNIELKFVHSMKRQYEFSVDSFQIILDTYLSFRRASAEINRGLEMSESFHPTVVAESVYGDFIASLRHLHQRRICTHKPEEIRGGGLLRYCNLLARDFTPGDFGDSPEEIARLEKHMCARFFIDFSDIEQQRRKLISYLDSHFQSEEEMKFQYLLILRRVVDNSTVCLMQHERAMILELITVLVRQSLAENVVKNSVDSGMLQSPVGSEMCSIASQCCNDYFNHQYSIPSQQPQPPYQYCDTYPPSSYNNYGGTNCPEGFPGPHPTRPLTPRGPVSFRPSQGPIFAPNCGPNYASYPNESKVLCCSCCCCCCGLPRSCHQTSYISDSVCQEQNYPAMMQPIYYNSSNVTCFYRPAGHRA